MECNPSGHRRKCRLKAELQTLSEEGRYETRTAESLLDLINTASVCIQPIRFMGRRADAAARQPPAHGFDLRSCDYRRRSGDANGDRSTVADEKGRFVIEGLVPGEYELRLSSMVRVGQEFWSSAPGIDIVNRRVTVGSGAETTVNLILGPPRK